MILSVEALRWSVADPGPAGSEEGTRAVLRGIALALSAGEVVGIGGASGAGKTSLGLAALRLLPGASGTVNWGGDDVTTWPERRLRPLRRRYQALLQSPQAMLGPFATVRQHLEETLRYVVGEDRPDPARWEAIAAALGLEPVLESRAHQLSGGEARRVGLARVMLCEPSFLFADEPDAGLDPPRRVELVEQLRELADRGTAILLVTHDEATLRRASDRILKLSDGVLVEGTRDEP